MDMGRLIEKGRIGRLLFAFIVINVTFIVACQNNSIKKTPPKAVHGVLDLNTWDLEKEGSIKLAGEWEFYWNQLLTPEDFSRPNPPEKSGFMYIPGCWNGYVLDGKKLSGDGYATYRLRILREEQKRDLALKIKDIHTAYVLYVNGKRLSSAGVVGKTADTTVPDVMPAVVDFSSETHQMEIILQISNFHHRLGGQWGAIQLGTEKEILNLQERSIVFDIFLCGGIFLIGLYHLCLFIIRPKDKSPLYFGMFCLLIVFRILTTGDKQFIYLFPNSSWELRVKIEYLSFYLAVPVFGTFIHSLFPREISRWVLGVVQLFGILFSAIVILTPAQIYSYTVQPYLVITSMGCVYGVYALILSLVRKRDGAVILFIGSFILFITVAYEMLAYSGVMTIVETLVPLGVLSFIFFQAILLSHRFSMAFDTIEKQRQDLHETNIAYLKEITERRRTEKALQEAYSIINRSPAIAFLRKNMEGLPVEFVSDNVMELIGYSAEEFLSGHISYPKIIHSEDLERVAREIKRFSSERNRSGFVHEPYRIMSKDGNMKWVDERTYMRRDPAGNITHYESIVMDITDRVRAEAEKDKLEAQLQQAQKMKAIGTLAGGIAHDFNNLLMAISGYNSILRLKIDPSHPGYKHLNGIMKCVDSASELTKQLLGFARGGKYEVKPINLNEVVKAQNRISGHTKKEITIHSKYEENLFTVEADRGQIEQVLMNIYVNAWQAMPQGGELRIQTENVIIDKEDALAFEVGPGKYAKISVTDTGVGMDEETRKRIFDPFFTTKEMERGTGMGLSSAYGIIKNHGGFITVYSEPGHGSTFGIFLPASKKKAVEDKKSPAKMIKGSGTVLLIDDEDPVLEVGEEILHLLGYEVMTAKKGQDAIHIYRENHENILLVILDMIMPEISSSEVYDELKKINPDIIVLLSSGYSINGKASEMLNSGCDGFIQKPFTMIQLSQKISEILNKPRSTPSNH